MADSKITALTSIGTSTDPAVDPLVLVDVSDTSMAATGTTKKVTLNNLLSSSPTATGNFTITGDLTVDTSTLKVDSANNRVGILTASPAYTLDVNGVANFKDATVHLVGGQPMFARVGSANSFLYAGTTALTVRNNADTSDLMTINSSGNVGIGVTPSAWWTGFKALESSNGVALLAQTNVPFAHVVTNASYDGANWLYKTNSNYANRYAQDGTTGQHQWFTAPLGGAAAAGTAFTFTQAMTLDASGNLLVGTTGLNGSWNTKLTLSNDSGTTKWAVGPYLGGVTNFLISAGASAGVYLNGTAATSWTSASDERLKDIIEPISNAIAKVGSLRAVIGKFKFDENNTRKPFLIAQDIQAVLPEAVDASNPDKLGVAYTDVIPLLVAAIKELTAEVNALKNA